ncbi:hypothetical protein [Streptosporangium sandarakinum]|uniref:hypothetical protein n=1 Tax=Streptosporangium sandarakinum TaxID=1260955 RepID=UPI0033AB4BF6
MAHAHHAASGRPALTLRLPVLGLPVAGWLEAVGWLEADEAARFLAAAAADPRPPRLRTGALLGVMLTEGVRVAEICGADIADPGHDRGWRTLTVTRKGGKRQVLPLAPPIVHA